MNHKKQIFILLLILITGSSAFLFAKARLEKGERYVIYAVRGQVTADTHSPNQGRIVLTEVNGSVTHFPAKGKPTKIETRNFFETWPEFDPKGSMTFQNNEEDTHLELVLSKPYYNRAQELISFDVRANRSLVPYHTIHEVNLYIHE